MSKLVDRLLILIMIAIAIGPVWVDYIVSVDRANWMLASAANRFDRGDVDAARAELESAVRQSPNIAMDLNFWLQWLRMNPQFTDSEEQFTRLHSMLNSLPDARTKAIRARVLATDFSNKGRFHKGMILLDDFLPTLQKRTSIENNLIAYMRACANEKLELALVEVDTALRTDQDPGILDTKAWVLHRLGRNEEALPLMEKSINGVREEFLRDVVGRQLITALDDLEKLLTSSDKANQELLADDSIVESNSDDHGQETADAEPVKSKSGWMQAKIIEKVPHLAPILPQLTRNIGTLRYHRMCILEALGKTDEAKRDDVWLQAFVREAREDLH